MDASVAHLAARWGRAPGATVSLLLIGRRLVGAVGTPIEQVRALQRLGPVQLIRSLR